MPMRLSPAMKPEAMATEAFSANLGHQRRNAGHHPRRAKQALARELSTLYSTRNHSLDLQIPVS